MINWFDGTEDSDGNKLITIRKDNIDILVKNSANWEKLTKLSGYVQNRSDVTIKMFQDDATKSFWIQVGNESNYGQSFEEALSKFEVEE